MQQLLFDQLSALPALNTQNRVASPCKICGGPSEFFDVVDFNKCCSDVNPYMFGRSGVEVAYNRCLRCDFVFSNFFDDWTPEDFARFVYNDDYIKVDGEYAGQRPRRMAGQIAERLGQHTNVRLLDYGSGSGLFAEHLREHGFTDVHSYDPFSSPARPAGRFDVITCFEVLEHTPAPRETLADIAGLLRRGGCILFSTGVQPPDFGKVRAAWWYIAPRNGHTSIYSLRSLAVAGRALGLAVHGNGGGLAFAGVEPSAASRQILASYGLPTRVFELTAPVRGAGLPALQKTSWNPPERQGKAAFRWTKEPEITWRVQEKPVAPCEIVVIIPFRGEIKRGFADGCQLRIGERALKLTRGVGALVGSATLNQAVEPLIKLVTPPPMRPCDLRPVQDARSLGLAILSYTNSPGS